MLVNRKTGTAHAHGPWGTRCGQPSTLLAFVDAPLSEVVDGEERSGLKVRRCAKCWVSLTQPAEARP